MTKRSRNHTHTDHDRGSLDASAVADLLDMANESDVEKLSTDVAEVQCEVEVVKSDVAELKELITNPTDPGAPSNPGTPELPAGSEPSTPASTTALAPEGPEAPVLHDGQPATKEQAQEARARLAKANKVRGGAGSAR